MLHKSSKGFAVLEAVLLLVIVAIIGGTSWYVWQSRQETNKALDSSQDASDSAPKVTKITNFDECVAAGNPVAESYPEQCFANGKSFVNEDQRVETLDWATYKSTTGKFTLKYPKTWAQATHPEYCSDDLLLLGANKASVGACGSEDFGQMTVYSLAQQSMEEQKLQSPYYEKISESKVVVDGVSGTRQVGYASGEGEFGPTKGTKAVSYVFAKGSRVYVARYIALSAYPDVLKDFDVVVTKTLKFN